MPPTGYCASAFFVASPATVAVLTFVMASGVTKNSCQSFSSSVMEARAACAVFCASVTEASSGAAGSAAGSDGCSLSGCSGCAASACSGSSPSYGASRSGSTAVCSEEKTESVWMVSACSGFCFSGSVFQRSTPTPPSSAMQNRMARTAGNLLRG